MTVGNVKIALPEKFALLLHPHVDVPCRLVVRNVTLDGKLCLCDDKNAAFVIVIHQFTSMTSLSLAMAGTYGKLHTMHACKPQVSDWMNPIFGGPCQPPLT